MLLLEVEVGLFSAHASMVRQAQGLEASTEEKSLNDALTFPRRISMPARPRPL